MPRTRSSIPSSEIAWFVLVPKTTEFTQPQFHFGERVKWLVEIDANRQWLTGRIKGMWFAAQQWEYLVALDAKSVAGVDLEAVEVLAELDLKLVTDAATLRQKPQLNSEWQPTDQAAKILGLSADQLRNLRLKGFFIEGEHYRDASLPNSNRAYWQWHVERCNQFLTVRST